MSIHEDRAKRKAATLFGGIEFERAGRGKVGYLQSDGTFHPNTSVGLSAGLIWVLLEGERSSVSAIPAGVSARYGRGFDVNLKRDRVTRTLFAYIDIERAIDSVGAEAALTLAIPDTVGDLDDSIVNQRRLKLGRLYAPAGGLVFRVRGFWYRDSNGASKWWNDRIQDADHEADTSGDVPAGADDHCLVIVSLNPDATTPALVATVGSDVSISTTFAEDDIETLVATVNSAYYPLYALELINGEASVPETQIWAIQEMINKPPSGGSSSLPNMGSPATITLASDVAAAGSDRNLVIAAESGTADDLIEITGLNVGDEVILRADAGDTITVKDNDAGATDKILLYNTADVVLTGDIALRLTKVASGKVVQPVDAADLSTSFPRRVHAMWHKDSTVLAGSFTIGVGITTTHAFNAVWLQSSAAVNNAWTQSFALAAGTFTLSMLGRTTNDQGIMTVYVDNVSQGTVDWYSAAGAVNVTKTLSITTTTDGVHVLKIIMATKNASSSNYYWYGTAYSIYPTAD